MASTTAWTQAREQILRPCRTGADARTRGDLACGLMWRDPLRR